jgi:hypothetical protein
MSITLGQLGLIHEFGTEHIPPRPFLGPAIENNRASISALSRELLLKMLHGEMTSREALGKLGAHGQGLVQQQIRETYTPPLAPATIKRKGSSHPLIDSGQMMQNVQWEYEE